MHSGSVSEVVILIRIVYMMPDRCLHEHIISSGLHLLFVLHMYVQIGISYGANIGLGNQMQVYPGECAL